MANKVEDYSAYQLTLVPYALMSFVNIVSGFFTPSYPAVYMVRSSVMEEAEGRGAVFDGWVGELEEVGELGKDGNVTCKPTTAEGAKGESRSSEDPNTGEGQETLKDHNNEEQSKRLEDPNAGMILETQTDQNAGDQLKQSKGAEVAEGQSKKRHISRRKRQEATMRFGKFWDIDKKITPSVTYFYHLGSSLPLIRFILKSYTVFKNLTTGSSLHVFNEVFNKKRKKRKRPEGYYYVLQIGNVKYRETTKKWMRYIMDLVMIAALAVPWVTIYHLTGFGAPKDRVAGVFFILWLTLGQLLPFLLVPSWQLINLKVWRIKLIQSILMGFLCVFLFSAFAVGGFYFVGELRYQELVKTNNNCSKSQLSCTYELVTDYNYKQLLQEITSLASREAVFPLSTRKQR
jgi:hypothetical protein